MANRLALGLHKAGMTKMDATHEVRWHMLPRTYIFSFTTKLQPNEIARAVSRWHESKKKSKFPCFRYLPTVIVTEGTVGLLSVEPMKIEPSADDDAQIRAKLGADARVLMGFWAAQEQFGWLILRLLHDIFDRLGLVHNATQIPFSITSHLPFEQYANKHIKGQSVGYVVWRNLNAKKKKTKET